MTNLPVFIILSLISINHCLNNGDVIKRLRLEPSRKTQLINSRVKFICETVYTRTLSFVFTISGKMVGEDCKAYFHEHDSSCESIMENGQNITIHTLTIKKLKWSDRGKWTCKYGTVSKHTFIDVKVPPIVQKLKPKLKLPPKNMAKIKSSSMAGSLIGGGGDQSFRRGRGSKTNPINLRDGAVLLIQCQTTCSHPSSHHQWTYGNATQHPVKVNINKTKMYNCLAKETKNQKRGDSFLSVNCSTLKMIGANEIACMAEDSRQVIYVLCPGGNKPWSLTFGEIIALALSTVLLILLIVLLSLLIRSQSRRISASQNGGAHKRLRKSSSSLVPHSIHQQAGGMGVMVPALPPPTPGSLTGGVIGVAETGSLIGGPGQGGNNSDVGINTGVRV